MTRRMPIGKRVRKARLHRKLSIADVAGQAGLHRETIRRIEGGAMPSADTLMRIGAVLEISFMQWAESADWSDFQAFKRRTRGNRKTKR